MNTPTLAITTSYLGQAVRTKADVLDFRGKCGVVVGCHPTAKYPLQVTFLIYANTDPDRRIALSCFYAPEELEILTEADDAKR